MIISPDIFSSWFLKRKKKPEYSEKPSKHKQERTKTTLTYHANEPSKISPSFPNLCTLPQKQHISITSLVFLSFFIRYSYFGQQGLQCTASCQWFEMQGKIMDVAFWYWGRGEGGGDWPTLPPTPSPNEPLSRLLWYVNTHCPDDETQMTTMILFIWVLMLHIRSNQANCSCSNCLSVSVTAVCCDFTLIWKLFYHFIYVGSTGGARC